MLEWFSARPGEPLQYAGSCFIFKKVLSETVQLRLFILNNKQIQRTGRTYFMSVTKINNNFYQSFIKVLSKFYQSFIKTQNKHIISNLQIKKFNYLTFKQYINTIAQNKIRITNMLNEKIYD